jgi:tRNA/rRNA methyltransferase
MLSKTKHVTQITRGLEANLIDDHSPANLSGLGGESQPGVAFLFGSERFGMRNEDVYRCHVCLSIPSNPSFGSLNIGAAIQVIAYEWRLALGGFTAVETVVLVPTSSVGAADAAQVAGMLAHLEQSLVALGFLDPAAPKKLMPRLNQLFNRASVTPEEIHILRGIAKAILKSK